MYLLEPLELTTRSFDIFGRILEEVIEDTDVIGLIMVKDFFVTGKGFRMRDILGVGFASGNTDCRRYLLG